MKKWSNSESNQSPTEIKAIKKDLLRTSSSMKWCFHRNHNMNGLLRTLPHTLNYIKIAEYWLQLEININNTIFRLSCTLCSVDPYFALFMNSILNAYIFRLQPTLYQHDCFATRTFTKIMRLSVFNSRNSEVQVG